MNISKAGRCGPASLQKSIMDLTDPLIWPAQTKKHLPKKNSIRTQEKQIFKGTKFFILA